MAIHLISPAPNAPILNVGKKTRIINKETEMLSTIWFVVAIPITKPTTIKRFGILLLRRSVTTATANNKSKRITISVTSYENTNKEFIKKNVLLNVCLKCLLWWWFVIASIMKCFSKFKWFYIIDKFSTYSTKNYRNLSHKAG